MTEEMKSAWEPEAGLPNDFDGWMTNPRFGTREEYLQKVQVTAPGTVSGLMFLVDLINKDGELEATQGWSLGTGWIPSDDGMEISHPKRSNVVKNSLYGSLQVRVTKDLGVKMDDRGLPTQAKSWDGLGFHWNIEDHPVVSRGESDAPKTAQGLMPTDTLPELKGAKTAKAAAPAELSDLEKILAEMVNSMERGEFQLRAMKKEGVAADDTLMARVLDDGPDGFYATHKKS